MKRTRLPAPCRSRVLLIACASLAVLPFGCEQGIHQYRVPKSASRNNEIKIEIPQGTSAAWFFKLSGPEQSFDRPLLDTFGEFLRSVRLSADSAPRYELPSGWTEEQATPPRFKTIKIPDTNPPLEVAVSYLTAPNPQSLEYLQINFNRWRGQLGLDPDTSADWFEKAEANDEIVRFSAPQHTIAMVILQGKSEEFGATRTLTAMMTPGADEDLLAQQRAEMPSESTSTPPRGIHATKPENWQDAPRNQFAVAAYSAKNDAGTMEVTISPVGGSALENINRWCGQVGVPTMSETEFAQKSSPIEIAGTPGTFVNLAGPENSIAGAVVVHAGQQWFFKGRGPAAVVALELDRFKGFLSSVEFE